MIVDLVLLTTFFLVESTFASTRLMRFPTSLINARFREFRLPNLDFAFFALFNISFSTQVNILTTKSTLVVQAHRRALYIKVAHATSGRSNAGLRGWP